jgi:hypothetical protein
MWWSLRALAAILALLAADAHAQCVFDSDCGGFDPCIASRQCVGGTCVFTPKICDDGNPCTIDRCDQTVGCVADPKCPSDGLVCNGLERCFAPIGFPAICIVGSPPNCDDGNACTLDGACTEPGGCPHTTRDCNDGNPCTTDGCDPATGCTHAPIASCCRSGGDCPADACTIRACVASTCTGGTPVDCDDADPATVDGCDPATGCTHATLPVSGCTSDVECPADADPCTVERCIPSQGCASQPVDGFDRLACACRRALPAACAGTDLPRPVTARRSRACALIVRAATDPAKQPRLLRRAGRQLAKAAKRLTAAKTLADACRETMGAELLDAVQRAEALRQEGPT